METGEWASCEPALRTDRVRESDPLHFPPLKRVAIYGLVGGVLIALLKLVEYEHFVRTYPAEMYGGIIALLFAGIGIYLGFRAAGKKEVVVVREVPVADEPFIPDEAKVEELGITPREHEILGLIAEGLSNREIGERLFVSENTVKTHSSRLFQKMEVKRRTQAVQRGKDLRLIP